MVFFPGKTELQRGISHVMPQGRTPTLRARGTPEIGGDVGPELCGCLLLRYLSQGHHLLLGRCRWSAGLQAKAGAGDVRDEQHIPFLGTSLPHTPLSTPRPTPPVPSPSDPEGLLSQHDVSCILQQPQAIVLPNNNSSLSLLGELLIMGKSSLALWAVISLHAPP